MNEPTFYGVAVNRTRPFAHVISGLVAAGHRVEIDLDGLDFTFPNASERIRRPAKVRLKLLRFDRSLNPLHDAEKFANAAGTRLADLWETAEMAVAHPELFLDRGNLPLVVLGELLRFSKNDVRVPIFPNLGVKGLPPLLLEACGNFVGDVHFPVVKLSS